VRATVVLVPVPRLLDDGPAGLEDLDLPRHLVLDGALDEAEGVEVLDLGARAELLRSGVAHRDVGIAAKGPLLHVAVADLEVAHQRVHLLHVGDRLLRRAQVGLRDDLHERGARAVEVDARDPRQPLVQTLAGILLEVRAGDADALDRTVLEHDADRAVGHDRQLVLADLIALRQVGVEVILAREHGGPGDARVDCEPELHGHAHRLGVQHRQHTRIAEVDEVRLCVRGRAVGGRGAGEDLRARGELRMDLEPDDGLPLAHA
jgi:hypothetical protein